MLRPLLVLSSVLAVLLASVSASAAISVSNYRREGTSRIFAATPFNKDMGNAGFNRSDCFDEKQLVRVFVSSIPSDADHVELWVRRDNTSCANIQNWPGGTDPQCARVKSWTRETANNQDVTFKPIEVIQAVHRRAHADTTTLDPATVCTDNTSMTPTEFYFQMMAFKGDRVLGWTSGGTAAGEVFGFQSSYDIAGPPAPTEPEIGGGNGILVSTFKGALNPSSDFTGYRAYCFPSKKGSTTVPDGGTTPAADTATTTDSGADTMIEDTMVSDAAGDGTATDDTGTATDDTGTATDDTGTAATEAGTIPANCPPGVPFIAGEIPNPALDEFICLDGTNSASGKITISGLTNNTTYAIAIAASDRHGNSGPLSEVTCGTPKLTDDFFTLYRNAGGTGGGGWCSMGARTAPFGIAGATVLVALLARALRRKSR